MPSLLLRLLLLALATLVAGLYNVYPVKYVIDDAQFQTFSSCISSTFEEGSPNSEYDPACGTDGRSYFNRYSINCMNEVLPSVQFAFYGRCPREPLFLPMEAVRDWWVVPDEILSTVEACMGTCQRQFSPVCASDDKTYPNPCILGCVTASMDHIKPVQAGFCKQDLVVLDKCPPILQPFCGSDGVTYLNYCQLRFAMLTSPNLQPAHLGDCVRRLEAFMKVEPPKKEEGGCGGCGK